MFSKKDIEKLKQQVFQVLMLNNVSVQIQANIEKRFNRLMVKKEQK